MRDKYSRQEIEAAEGREREQARKSAATGNIRAAEHYTESVARLRNLADAADRNGGAASWDDV